MSVDTYESIIRAAALAELGVTTIWYSEHTELPNLIRPIRDGGCT